MMYDIKFRNTHLVKAASNYMIEHGVYTKLSEGDPERVKYWKNQERLSLYGGMFPIGNGGRELYIPGYFYFYLNFSPIMKIADKDMEADVMPKMNEEDEIIDDYDYENIVADRIEGFPDFWDGDFYWYSYADKAERSGEYAIMLKRRGTGGSFKYGSAPNRNYYLIPNSRSFLIANSKDYLTGDGILQKAWDNMNFIDKHTDFSKRRSKNTEMLKRAGYEEIIDGKSIEKGYKSAIIGFTTKDKPNKVRGIRGKLIVNEEAGDDPYIVRKWNILNSSVKQQKRVFGLLVGLGTGGSERADYKGLKELFYNPSKYNIRSIRNIWDDGASRQKVGFFWPTFINSGGFMDKDGNSDIKASIDYEIREREKKKGGSAEFGTYKQYVAENPFNPLEATLSLTANLFPLLEIQEQINLVETDVKRSSYAKHGKLYINTNGIVKFKEDDTLEPATRNNKRGCVTIYDEPFIGPGGVAQRGMYIIGHDPYAHDNTVGPSIGSAYVIKLVNADSTYRMDSIVASWNGRPQTLDEYNRVLFMLSGYYNAKIGFENDRGDVVGYAKRYKKLTSLSTEFEFNYNSNIPKTSIKRGYGMRMGSGKDNVIKLVGEQYLADWLMTERSVDEDGNILRNIHLIYDVELLKELLEYSSTGSGNYDRVMAMIVCMYHIKERLHKPIIARTDGEFYQIFSNTNKWFSND